MERSDRASSSGMAKLVVFRTPDQNEIPKPTWKITGPVIREGLRKHIHLVRLKSEEVALLYASREVYLEARAGDLQDCTVEEALQFLRGRLQILRSAVLGPVLSPPEPPEPVPAEKPVTEDE